MVKGRWFRALIAVVLGGAFVGSAAAAQPSFLGLWDMTTSQGGYFTLLMQDARGGRVLGTFQNDTPNQSGTWLGRPTDDGIDLPIVLKQPGLGLTGKGQLFLLAGGNNFQGSIEEWAADGSGKVTATVRGTRKSLPLPREPRTKVNP